MKTNIDDFEIDYQYPAEGSGRTLALAHSLGMAGRIFDPLRPILSGLGRILTWDARGHGHSERPATGWSIQDLARDLDGLLSHLGVKRAVVGGLSMGGCSALAYALAHPDRIEGLILMDTTAGYGEEKRSAWEQRAAKAEAEGMEPVVPFNLPRWFSDGFLESSPDKARAAGEILKQNDPSSYAAACRALGAFDVRDQLGEIRCPTLIIVGEGDPATPVAMAEQMHAGIAGSELHVLDGLRHMSAVEAPERIGGLIADFLKRL